MKDKELQSASSSVLQEISEVLAKWRGKDYRSVVGETVLTTEADRCILAMCADELEPIFRHAQAEIEGLRFQFDALHTFLDLLLCEECNGTGRTDNHVTGEVECSSCDGTGHDVRKAKAVVEAAEARAEAAEGMNRELSNLTGAMAAQDEREANAGERCGVLRELHGCDWPDAVAERLLTLEQALQEIARLRLATDEGSLRVRSDRMWEVCEAALAASRGRAE